MQATKNRKYGAEIMGAESYGSYSYADDVDTMGTDVVSHSSSESSSSAETTIYESIEFFEGKPKGSDVYFRFCAYWNSYWAIWETIFPRVAIGIHHKPLCVPCPVVFHNAQLKRKSINRGRHWNRRS